MKKNTKGFTLIELLAIIVILAIIAVITIPVILNVIENSRKGASVDSAYGYKESVQQYYISKAVANHNDQAPSGYKKVSSLSSEGFSVSGDTPTDGWVKLDKGQVIDYSLKFGDYVVSYDKTTNSAVPVKNGEIGPMPAAKLYSESNNTLTKKDKSQMQVGDIVVLETETLQEKFIVLNDPNAPTGTTALLAINNLNVGPSKNSSLAEGYQGKNNLNENYPVQFTSTVYWNTTGQSYPVDIYDEKNEDGTYKADVMMYIADYVLSLQNNGFSGITNGRILTFSDVNSNDGMAISYKISNKKYLLGSALNGTILFAVDANGGSLGCLYNDSGCAGVRPLIYINTDDIE